MNRHSDPAPSHEELREKLIGLGERSVSKSYYPELQKQLENLKERVELAELVAEIGRGLTEERDLRSSLQRCCETLIARTDAAFVRLWVLAADGETLELQASAGLHTNIDGRHSRLNIFDLPYMVCDIARNKQPLLTNQVIDHPQFHDQDWIRQKEIVGFAGYPLLLQQRMIGVIALFSCKPLNNTVLDTLATIVNQIAISIENYQILDAYKASLANARESHEKVNGILRSVADGLLVVDNHQRIVHMNKAAERLLGVTLVTVTRKMVDEVTRETALLDYINHADRFNATEKATDLTMIDKSCNEQRVIQARSARLPGARSGSGLVISLRDVTHDREIARLKSEFITTAAHELRTPLTTILGFAELLESEECSPEIRREYLGYILDKSAILEQIISDLLDLSRIESGRGLALNYSDWDLDQTLEKIMRRCRSEYHDYRFSAALANKLGRIHADQGKVLQVIDNLLSNAIKYSPKGSEIHFEANRTDNDLTIRVTDQGIGMTPEQIGACFDKFYRVDNSDTAVGGLGLGLSIARQVVEAHNGRIWIDSQPGVGTTVTFTLPTREERETFSTG